MDHYLHLPGAGPFNKSWTLNVGVRHTPGSARALCLLDADILVDREFLERNHARFRDSSQDAHLPHTEMASLDEASSDRAIEQRRGSANRTCRSVGSGPAAARRSGARRWIRPEIFHMIGGLDERYLGWGGEDEDMLYRTSAVGSVIQYDDVFLHLAHARPAMRDDEGKPFNAHLKVGSWNGASRLR